MNAAERALSALDGLPPEEQLCAAQARLSGKRAGPLETFEVGSELVPGADRLDGSLLETLAVRGLGGARGAVFTPPAEARILAALGLARAAVRRGAEEGEALRALLGLEPATARVSASLRAIAVLDPACGGGALLAAALALVRRCGAEPVLRGLDVAPLAAEATRARLTLLGADAEIAWADALLEEWPPCDLVLANPPFLRHEALAPAEKARAVARTGLPARADLSAHLALLALCHAPDVALVWPRALDGSRSAAALRTEARARGGFSFRLRSRASGSFAASVETALAVWSLGAPERPTAEADVPLPELSPAELAGLADGKGSTRLHFLRGGPGPSLAPGSLRLRDVCAVRFGVKTGCNGFFHLQPLGAGRFVSRLAGEVALRPKDAPPVLTSLKEASAPCLVAPRSLLFRPLAPGPDALAYAARGEALGVHRRPTCRQRRPWWSVAHGRAPAPVLYPAKVGARAFAVLNEAGLWEDKKWHALFPGEEVAPWLVAAVLLATPVRLAVDAGARQLTGKQAIADVDCHVLASAPFPALERLAEVRPAIAEAWAGLARDPVTTDLEAMLKRPAQLALDLAVGEALGLGPPAVHQRRAELLELVLRRIARGTKVRSAIAASAAAGPRRDRTLVHG